MRNQVSLSFLLLITLTFIFTPIVQGDTVKTAIIADSPEADKLVDIIIPKVSKITGIELLERQRIKSVLQEQKLQATGLTAGKMASLSKILHADIFAIINSGGAKALPVSLRIFDARNGFIIDDKALPSGNLTVQTDYIVKELEKSLKSIKIRKIPIAVLAIRNAGITKPLFYKCIKLTAQINRNIAASPDIMMLERTNLEMVNRERKITEKIFAMKNAAILLDFEFLPMDIPDKIQMQIRVLDRKGKIQKVFNYKNVTYDNSLAKTTATNIISSLKVRSGKIASSPKQEARRFYQEFKYIHKINFEAARRKISAAIALDPEKLDYRRDFAYLLMNEAEKKIRPNNNNDKYLQMLHIGLQILYEIRKASPNYHPNNLFSKESHVFTTFANHYNNRKVPEKLIEYATLFRNGELDEMLKYYPTKLNKDEVFDSVKEMSNYCNIMNRIHRLSNFLSTNLLIESYFASLENYVERSAAFLNKKPKLATKISLKQQIYLAPWKMPISFTYNPNSKLFFKTIDRHRKLIAGMKQHPLPLIKADGALFELYANLYRNSFSVDKFKRNLTEYFKYIAPLLPDSHASRRTIYLWCRWQYLRSDLQTPKRYKLRKTLIEKSVVFMNKRNWCNIDDLFAYILYAEKNRKEFLKRVLVLRKYKELKKISSSNKSNVYRRLKMYMRKIKPILIGFDQTPLYNELEVAVGIKTKISAPPTVHCLLPHRSEFWRQKNGNNKIIAAEKHGDDIYFCFSDLKRIKGPKLFKFYISLAVFNLKDKWGNKLSSYEGLFHNSRSRVFYNSLIYRRKFYLACREGVLVFPLDGSSPYLIDKLPGKYVYTIAGLDNRIYIAVEGKPLSDNNKPPIQTVLLSCKPDGSDRKIIFSSLDRAKRNFFDRDKPFKVEYIWGDEKKKRLLMIAGKPLGGLWEFYPQSGKYKNLCRLTPFEFGWGKFINNRLYFSMRSNVFFEYSPERNRTRFILSRSKYYRALAQKYSGLKPEYEIKSFGADNFYRTGNWIWLANDWDMCRIDMNIPNNLTRLPRVRNNGSEFIMLPWDKGKAMIAVSSREIFYLGEKTSSFKQETNPEIFKTPLMKNLGL